IRGGIYRRKRNLSKTEESYREGKKYELDPEFGADESYNLVNALVVPLLEDPTLVDRDDFKNDLAEAMRLLRRQTRGPRSTDFWAYADLARCLLLSATGEIAPRALDDAYRALDRFVELGGLKDAFNSTMQVLRELQEVFSAVARPETEAFTKGIEYLRKA